MKNPLLFITTEIAFFMAILIFLPALVIRHRQFHFPLPSTQTLPFEPGQSLVFHLSRAPRYLDSISFDFKNPNLANQERFSFSLVDTDSNRLYSADFFGSNIGDPGHLVLRFHPLDIPHLSSLIVIIDYHGQATSPPIFYQADQSGLPLFGTTFHPTGLLSSLATQFQFVVQKFIHQSHLHQIAYLIILISLNFLYLRPHGRRL